MASDTPTPTSQIPEPENPKKTLTLAPTNASLPPGESRNPSSIAEEEQSRSTTDGPGEGTDKEVSDSKVTPASQDPDAVVSPTGDGGPINDIQKKLRRAERFGVPVQLSEEEKRNSRAERFGTATGSEASKSSEELKRKARAERFGLPVPADNEAKKKARLARFGSDVKTDPVEQEKRKARAIRFSQSSSNSVPHINNGGDVGQKTVIASNATGGA